jgi:hypothetical protein
LPSFFLHIAFPFSRQTLKLEFLRLKTFPGEPQRVMHFGRHTLQRAYPGVREPQFLAIQAALKEANHAFCVVGIVMGADKYIHAS